LFLVRHLLLFLLGSVFFRGYGSPAPLSLRPPSRRYRRMEFVSKTLLRFSNLLSLGVPPLSETLLHVWVSPEFRGRGVSRSSETVAAPCRWQTVKARSSRGFPCPFWGDLNHAVGPVWPSSDKARKTPLGFLPGSCWSGRRTAFGHHNVALPFPPYACPPTIFAIPRVLSQRNVFNALQKLRSLVPSPLVHPPLDHLGLFSVFAGWAGALVHLGPFHSPSSVMTYPRV